MAAATDDPLWSLGTLSGTYGDIAACAGALDPAAISRLAVVVAPHDESRHHSGHRDQHAEADLDGNSNGAHTQIYLRS